MRVNIDNKQLNVYVEPIDAFNSKITVYEDNNFLGKTISNDVEFAVKEMIRENESCEKYQQYLDDNRARFYEE